MPFCKPGPNEPCQDPGQIKLGLTEDPSVFDLLTSFRYEDKFDANETVVVQKRKTDLASVPFFLQWLVRSYGKHTKAALVHDQLWGGAGEPERDLKELRRANCLFRHAMWELGVPWMRRWLMWAAVTLAMFGRSNPRVRSIGRLLVWSLATAVTIAALFSRSDWEMDWPTGKAVAAGAGTFAAAAGVVGLVAYVTSTRVEGDDPKRQWRAMATSAWGVAGAVVALTGVILVACAAANVYIAVGNNWFTLDAHNRPLVGSVGLFGLAVWGRSFGAGIIATIAVLLLAIPVVGIGAALLLYSILELLALLILAVCRWIKGLPGGKEPKGPLNPMMRVPGR